MLPIQRLTKLLAGNTKRKLSTSHMKKYLHLKYQNLFTNAFKRVATPEKVIKGFQNTGICHFFCEEDFEPARLHNISQF